MDWRRAFRRFNRNRLTQAGALVVLALMLIAVFAPLLAPYDPVTADTSRRFRSPDREHPFGTDELGRDILSRVIHGTRLSLRAAGIVLAISASLGIAIGSIAGLCGGFADEALMRLTDIFLAFPALILAMAIAAALGPGLENGIIAIAATWWPWYARLVRGQVLAVKEKEYVEAARALGGGWPRLLWRHILPGCLSPVIVQMSLDVGYAVLLCSSLSFVGLGAQAPLPEWGAMVATGRKHIMSQWWYATFPGLAVMVSVLGFNLLGDGLRDLFDPTARH